MKYDELMRFHTQNEKNFEELREAYSRDIIVPFVGSGLCVPPYNTWGNSLKSICSNVPSALPELERLLETGEYERAANHVFDALEIARFTKAFSEEFSPEKIHAVGLSPSMEILSEIFTGLVVTTNYDRCLEVSYEKMKRGFNSVFCIRDTSGYQHVIDQMLRNQPHYLLKIHGDIYNQSSRVLLESEYEELYAENGPFIKMLSQFFLYKQFLFLGCSMTGKDRYMRVLKQVANKHEVPSFAILPTLKKKKKESKAQYKARVEEWEAILSEHWILPVFYPDGDYESVTELLINLKTTSQLNSGKRAIHETGFFGRTDLVRDIQKQLMQSHYMIIHGVGGIGKTQICEEIVSQFPGDSVKVYLQGATGFSTLLQSVCNALGLNLVKNEVDDAPKKKAILGALYRHSENTPFLLYLDNFEDVLLQNDSLSTSVHGSVEIIKNADPSVAWITELMSEKVRHFYLLISSRDVLTGVPSKWVEPLDKVSMFMLFQYVFIQSGGHMEQLTQEADALSQLIHHLSGHPLAAVLAASQVTISRSIRRILEMWKVAGNPQVNIAIDQNPTHRALSTALLVSYKHIGNNHDAKLLWGYLALVPQDLPDELSELLLPDTITEAEICLISLSLAERNRQGNGLSMLEPIKMQAFTYDQSIRPECLKQMAVVYASIISKSSEDESKLHFAVKLISNMLYYVNFLIDHKSEDNYKLLKVVLNKADAFRYLFISQPKSSLVLFEKLIADKYLFDSFDDATKAIIYEGRADCSLYNLLHTDAIEYYRLARELNDKCGEQLHASYNIVNMGVIEYWNSNYVKAENLYLEAKRKFEEADSDAGLAKVLLSLGELYERLSLEESNLKEIEENRKKAICYFNQARQAAEKTNDKHCIANIDYYIGSFYTQEDKDIALDYLGKALKQYKIEHDNLGCGNVYADIGHIYYKSEPKKAFEYYTKAVQHYMENEMPESYYSNVMRRMKICHEKTIKEADSNIDFDEIIARIDQRISEIDAEIERLEKEEDTSSTGDTSQDKSE